MKLISRSDENKRLAELSDVQLASELLELGIQDSITHALARILLHVTPEAEPPILPWIVLYTHHKADGSREQNTVEIVAFTGDDARDAFLEQMKPECTMNNYFVVNDVMQKEGDKEDE